MVSTFAKGDTVAEYYIKTFFDLLESGVPYETLIDLHFTRIYGHDFLMQAERIALIKLALSKEAKQTKPAETYRAHALASLMHDTSNELAKIRTNTIILSGDEDLMIPVKHSNYLKAHIANSTFVQLEGVGHVPQVEKPELFAQVIIDGCSDLLEEQA